MHSFFSTTVRWGWGWGAKGGCVSPPQRSAPPAAAGAGGAQGLAQPAGRHHPALGKLVPAEISCGKSKLNPIYYTKLTKNIGG